MSRLYFRLPCSRGFMGAFRGTRWHLIQLSNSLAERVGTKFVPIQGQSDWVTIVLYVCSSAYVITLLLPHFNRSRQGLDDERGHTFGRHSKYNHRGHKLDKGFRSMFSSRVCVCRVTCVSGVPSHYQSRDSVGSKNVLAMKFVVVRRAADVQLRKNVCLLASP